MATQNKNISLFNKADVPSAKGMHFGIVVSNWNTEITANLLEGTKATLLECGALESKISVMEVPGSFELVFGAKIISKQKVDVWKLVLINHGTKDWRDFDNGTSGDAILYQIIERKQHMNQEINRILKSVSI